MSRALLILNKTPKGYLWHLWIIFADTEPLLVGFGKRPTKERAEADGHRRAATIAMSMVKLVNGEEGTTESHEND